MKFSNYISGGNAEVSEELNEAKKSITTVSSWGVSPADLLSALYSEFGTDEFSLNDAKPVKKPFGNGDQTFALQKALINGGYLNRDGKNFQVTAEGEKFIQDGTETAGTVARGVKNMTNLKSKTFKVPKVSMNSKYVEQMGKLLSHMRGFSEGSNKSNYMLAGDPGTGKTSFIRSLSKLTGIPLVVIEAPHITQEHLINIPFLVFTGDKKEEGNVQVDTSNNEMTVVQAESNLVTRLKNKTKQTPEQVQAIIDKDRVLKSVQPLLQRRINMVAGRFNSILFLDEFYRTSSIKIRNVLRNILNGKIGNDKIPDGVYIIMATNLNQGGEDEAEIPLNHDFQVMNYDISSKEDFMSYMYGKYVVNPDEVDPVQDDEGNETLPENDTGIAVKKEVWNKFMTELKDSDLGFNDASADVRLSPRRLEQFIIGIDSMLPVASFREAQLLLAFVKTNLTNYLDGNSSDYLLAKFKKIAIDLMLETADDTLKPELDVQRLEERPLEPSDWREQLQSQIEMKMKLGDSRQYIPVVAGAPGIGKTTQMVETANRLGMGYIQVDVSNLNPENITGMPIADTKGENITTSFSDPDLYIQIMNEYNAKIGRYRQEGRKYNMILLFDELNRASVPVFNAIRKVLLEKSFEHKELPPDIIVTGAINPEDAGAIEFTSHTRDVLDIIPSAGKWSDTYNYLSNHNELKKISDQLGFGLHEAVVNMMSLLAADFQSPLDSEGRDVPLEVQYFWWSDGGAVFYVSPREMTSAVSNAVNQIMDALLDYNYSIDGEFTDEEYDSFIQVCVNIAADTFVDAFRMTCIKQEIEGFVELMGRKIVGNEKFKKLFEGIRTKKSANVQNLPQILAKVNGDVSFLDKGVIGEYIKDFSSTEMIQDIQTICDTYIDSNDDIINKVLKLYERVHKSLTRLNVANNYIDQLNKYIGGLVVGLMKSDKVDIIEIMEDDALMARLSKLA